jgi:hypothetical protein
LFIGASAPLQVVLQPLADDELQAIAKDVFDGCVREGLLSSALFEDILAVHR